MVKHEKYLYLLLGGVLFLFAIEFVKNAFDRRNRMPIPSTTLITPNPKISNARDYRNFYGISWRGNAHENLVYARQMKYDYVFYQAGMEKDTLSNGLYFYLETPEYFTYSSELDMSQTYSAKQITFYETCCALKNTTSSFPNNIATGWFDNNTTFRPLLDFQQQKVISFCIDSIVKIAKKIEAINPNFHFGGCSWDEPRPVGDFYSPPPTTAGVSLSYWTGGDYGAVHSGVTHDFSTYTDGHMAFYKQLYSSVRQNWPGAKFISEPYNIYDGWISQIQNRSDASQVTMDLLSQEGPGTYFVDDSRNFAGGLVTKDRVMSTTPNVGDEPNNRVIMAKAATTGATFNWFGRFGGSGNMPNYSSITQVPGWLKLIRSIPNWENINQTTLTQRTWDGTTYKSPTAYSDPKAIGVLQPGTKKYFVVLMTSDAQVTIPAGRTIVSISKTNTLNVEAGDGSADLIVSNGVVKLNGTAGLNNTYILKLN